MAGFEWKNLPEELDPRFLEMILCFDGKALFYYDEDLEEYVTLQFFGASPIDIYREPIRRTAYSPSIQYRYKSLTENESGITRCIRRRSSLSGFTLQGLPSANGRSTSTSKARKRRR